ncbi:hypothetical protein HK100_002646 [Physocladia obscura]|uniref:GRAM domain-containing protein n=1 Tax=Physocladia obscura TaxID=109957 RepID=A0AAD5XAX9_9FUNG|nr:hypothetical protein HK100_002646 [Physocladia obscura]
MNEVNISVPNTVKNSPNVDVSQPQFHAPRATPNISSSRPTSAGNNSNKNDSNKNNISINSYEGNSKNSEKNDGSINNHRIGTEPFGSLNKSSGSTLSAAISPRLTANADLIQINGFDLNANSDIDNDSDSGSISKPKKPSSFGAELMAVYMGATPKKMAKMFPELSPENDPVLFVYPCALEKEILWQGRLYVTPNYLCFYSTVFGKSERAVLKFRDIISIEKKMIASLFPNAIKVTLLDGQLTFASFLKRDSALTEISAQWKLSRNPHKILGTIAIERLSSVSPQQQPSLISKSTVTKSLSALHDLNSSGSDSSSTTHESRANFYPENRQDVLSEFEKPFNQIILPSDAAKRSRTHTAASSLASSSTADIAESPQNTVLFSKRSVGIGCVFTARNPNTSDGKLSAFRHSETAVQLSVNSPMVSSLSATYVSSVAEPPGMALLYDIKIVSSAGRNTRSSVRSSSSAPPAVVDSTGGGSGENGSSGRPKSLGRDLRRTGEAGDGSRRDNAGNSGNFNNRDRGDGNNNSNGGSGIGRGAAKSKGPAKCPCATHEGQLIINELIPHDLRGLIEKIAKEMGSKMMQDAFEACGSDGLVFWNWTFEPDGKTKTRDVEYTARFIGFRNAEPIFCKEAQRILASNEDDLFDAGNSAVVMESKISSVDSGNAQTHISFTNRCCLTYEGIGLLRMKVHSRLNNASNKAEFEKAMNTRNQSFYYNIIQSLKGIPATKVPSALEANAKTKESGEVPNKRTSSLPTTPDLIPPPAAENHSTTAQFWKTVVENFVIGPAKAAGILIPLEETAFKPSQPTIGTNSAAITSVTSTSTSSKKQGKKKKKQNSDKTEENTFPAILPPIQPPLTTTLSGTVGTAAAYIRASAANSRILAFAIVAVMFGLGLTVLNILWMAELSEQLERTLDAVRSVRERGAGNAKFDKPLPLAAAAAPAVESFSELRSQLIGHSQLLFGAIITGVDGGLGSVDNIRAKIHALREISMPEVVRNSETK